MRNKIIEWLCVLTLATSPVWIVSGIILTVSSYMGKDTERRNAPFKQYQMKLVEHKITGQQGVSINCGLSFHGGACRVDVGGGAEFLWPVVSFNVIGEI